MQCIADKQLAKTFASSDLEPVKPTFRELDQSALSKARQITQGCNNLDAIWREFTPILDQMQSLLSQRGETRNADLPGWTTWFKSFREKTGLDVTLRTVQNRLTRFRGMVKERQKPSDRPVQLTPRNQKRLLEAAHCTNQLVSAVNNGADLTPYLLEYKRISLDSDTIIQMLERLANEEMGFSRPSKLQDLPLKRSSAELPSQATLRNSSPLPLTLPSRPEAGDWRQLLERVVAVAGDDIRAAIQGLEHATAAEVFAKFAGALTEMYCPCNRGTPTVGGAVEPINSQPGALGQAA